MNETYKAAGVDVTAGYKSVELMKKHVQSTFRKEVLSDIGGFGGLFSLAKIKEMDEPVAVSGTDGVGTKLKIAFLMNKHETIGIDCVAMCANDIICNGAEPLFFLDYIACGKNDPERIAEIVKGVATGCNMANVSLVGGETAEMPGFYPEDEYDIAGFCVGVVDRKNIIDGRNIEKGDVLIGVASSGLHSNGYSLVRKVLRTSSQNIKEKIESLGTTLGEELLKPTKMYVKPMLDLQKEVHVLGLCNITGGGFIENIPRMIPKGLSAQIKLGSWPVLPIFKLLQHAGHLDTQTLYNTFNMGIGMVAAVKPHDAIKTMDLLHQFGETAYEIGVVTENQQNKEQAGIELC